LLNIKINQAKLVSVCGCKLATDWQNFTEIYLAYVKISQKVLGELLFWLTLYEQIRGENLAKFKYCCATLQNTTDYYSWSVLRDQ